jgi:hypothetical protein
MFALGVTELVILAAVAVACEVLLFWAAAALADVPTGWNKTVLVSLAGAVALGIVVTVTHSLLGPFTTPFDSATLPRTLLAAGLVLGLSFVLPAVLYTPLLSVSVNKGMLVSVLQVLLRIFLYVLITAVVMVVLAVLQIARRADAGPASPGAYATGLAGPVLVARS